MALLEILLSMPIWMHFIINLFGLPLWIGLTYNDISKGSDSISTEKRMEQLLSCYGGVAVLYVMAIPVTIINN